MKREPIVVGFVLLLSGCSQQKQTSAPPTAAPKPVEYFHVDHATAGQIEGQVRFTGKVPAARAISMDAEEACQKLHPKPVMDVRVATGKNRGLANAFVYIKSGLDGKVFEPRNEAVVLDQRGCTFVPRVVALRTGQTLQVKNSDPVSHNIHPLPQNNREWNQQQSPGAPDLERKFAHPEVMIPTKCNVHSWMHSFIGVVDHPYFAVTDTDGTFSWPDVPPGDYVVAVWHETLGELTEKVSVSPSAKKTVSFSYQ